MDALKAIDIPPKPARRRFLFLLAMSCIGLQFGGSLLLSGIALGIWLSTLILVDRETLHRMWMPRFWAITIIFALFSGLLLGPLDTKIGWITFSSIGLKAGALMVFRGAFIFGFACWASRSVDEKEMKRFTKKIGLGKLGTSVVVAMRVLPDLQNTLIDSSRNLSKNKSQQNRARNAYAAAIQTICRTVILAEEIERKSNAAIPNEKNQTLKGETTEPRAIAAVVGPPGTGKTTTIDKVAQRLKANGFDIGGIIQPSVYDKSDGRDAYLLMDVGTCEKRPFAKRRTKKDENQVGFEFDPNGWTWANDRIICAKQTKQILIVDEMGRLEGMGKGHMPSLLEETIPDKCQLWLFGVRADQSANIQNRLGPFDLQLPAGASAKEIDEFVKAIEKNWS